jgi:hypothetical protein
MLIEVFQAFRSTSRRNVGCPDGKSICGYRANVGFIDKTFNADEVWAE